MKTKNSRERWIDFIAGKDDRLTAPLADDWCLSEPYRWPFKESDPFPPGHQYHCLSQQIAMGKICGYDPLLLYAPPFVRTNNIETNEEKIVSGDRETSLLRINTPYGILEKAVERSISGGTCHVVKDFITEEEDYKKYFWYLQETSNYDCVESVKKGKAIADSTKDRGLRGTWMLCPIIAPIEINEIFLHMADYPDLYEELVKAQMESELAKMELLKEMGYDYLFCAIPGTELCSPTLFEQYVLPYTKPIFQKWQNMGGLILCHTCGYIKTYIERGYYNDLHPDIFETLNVSPLGDLPSLRWAREKLDRSIVTKGNLSLEILLDGPIERIVDEVERICIEVSGYRHVIGASDDVLYNTPLEHIRAMVTTNRG